jgi:adenylate kinase
MLASMFQIQLLTEWFASALRTADTQVGFSLDGYPRTVAQVAELDGMLSAKPLDRVIELTADTDVVVKRLTRQSY